MNSIHLLAVVVLSLQFIQSVTQWISAFFVQKPSVFFIDKIIIKFDEIFDSRIVKKFGTWNPPEVEEVLSKPDLLLVCFVIAFCDDLLNCIPFLAFLVLSKPYKRKSTPSQQLYFIIAIRKPVSKGFHLLIAQIIRVFLLPLPLDFYFLYRVRCLGLEPSVTLLRVCALLRASNSSSFLNLVGIVVKDTFLVRFSAQVFPINKTLSFIDYFCLVFGFRKVFLLWVSKNQFLLVWFCNVFGVLF